MNPFGQREKDVESYLNEISKPAIVRLARRAGVKSLNKLVYDEVRNHIRNMLENWLSNVVVYMEYSRKKTIDSDALVSGIPHKYFSKPVNDALCKKEKVVGSGAEKSILEIQHYQSLAGCLMIPKLPFARLAKAIALQYKFELRMSKEVIVLLQHCLENCVVEMLNKANLMSFHAGRSKVQVSDIQLYVNANEAGHCGVGGLSAGEPEINFQRFINVLYKQMHPDMKVNKISRSQLNQLLNLLTSAITEKAVFLNQKNKVKTISARTIQSAIQIILPGELRKQAISNGTMAVVKYIRSKDEEKGVVKSKQARSGLVLSVSRVSKFFKKYKTRLTSGSSVYLTSVVEYILAEVLAVSANVAKDHGKNVVNSRHLMLGIKGDAELSSLSKSLCFDIVDGGVMPRDM